MFKNYIDDISFESIVKCINSYREREAVALTNNFNYYNGKQAIYSKEAPGDRPCNKVVTNFCRQIADTYYGFIDISKSTTTDPFIQNNILVLADTLRDVIISSVGYTLTYYENSIKRMVKLRPTTTMVLRDTSVAHNVIAAVTWNYYSVIVKGVRQLRFEMFVYDSTNVYHYEGLTLESCVLKETSRHYVGYVPIHEYRMTSHYENIFGSIIDLQDSYNSIDSSYVDGRETFSNSYLLIKGMVVDEESTPDLINSKSKIINLPAEGSDASYLVKPDSATEVISMLNDIRLRIFTVTSTPDFLASNFSAASGTAMQYRLIGFINNVIGIETEFLSTINQYVDGTFSFQEVTLASLQDNS